MAKRVLRFLAPDPLRVLADAAADIAKGDRYRKVPMQERDGAAGDMARALDALRRALLEADAAIAEQEADRDYQDQRRASTEAFVTKFEQTVEGVQRSLDQAASGMRDAAGSLASQAGTVAGRSQEVRGGADSVAHEVATLAEASGQMDAALGELEGRAARAADVIATAVGLVDQADSTIRGLSQAADRIGDMAHAIADIAGQTRMLALNATIEAARAGEAGKGFAVVAGEVKSLVAETERATDDIDRRAKDIQQAAEAAVSSMGAIAGAMHDVNALVAAVAAAMHQQSAASHAISSGARTAAAETEAMTAAIGDVAKATEHTRAEAGGVQSAAEDLTRQSDTLRGAVTTFLDDLDHGAIKIGILHSLSGGSAVGERPLKDVLLMEIKALNAQGGLLGRPVEALLYNPRGEATRTAELADKALAEDGVSALFGGWSSTSRKALLPVLDRHDGLLFYPSQYEGAEADPHVAYCGAPPNQQLLPAIEYLMSAAGGGYRRFFLVGNDTLYPRMTHGVLRDFLTGRGVTGDAVRERLAPVGADDWARVVAEIRTFARQPSGPALVVSTVGGDSNFYFFRQMGGADIPVLTVSIGEAEAALMDPRLLAGHMVAWTYLMSVDTPENRDFLGRWRAHEGHDDAVVNDAMEASVLGFRLWAEAVRRAGTTDPASVRAALRGLSVRSLTGFDVTLDPVNNHLHKPALVGRLNATGGIDILWRSAGLIAPEPGDAAEMRLAAE